MGGELVSINTQSESDFLNDRLMVATWTSGTRVGDSNNWKWSSPKTSWPAVSPAKPDSIFRNWNKGEPNDYNHHDGNHENCIQLRPWTAPTTWNDERCSEKMNIVCETQHTHGSAGK